MDPIVTGDKLRGFSLVEIMVVVLMIGIMSGFALPSFLKTVETSKALDAATTVEMIGTANRMFALDHTGDQNYQTLYPTPYQYGSNSQAIADCDCSGGCGGPCCWDASNPVACAMRKKGIFDKGTDTLPYANWGYVMDRNGLLRPLTTAPTTPTRN